MRVLFVVALLFISTASYKPAQAQPPLWQNDFGTELTTVSSCDDCAEEIALPFPFPFNGSVFNTAYVGANGCIQLGGLGLDDDIGYNLWESMEEFLSDSDPDNPIICPFNNDLIPQFGGTIFYNDTMDPVVITWDMVASIGNFDALATFQILLYSDGRIVFNYNGILVGYDLNEDLEEGIVVGVTPSDLLWDGEPFVPGDPGPVNLVQGPFDFGPTVYGRWCYDDANSCGVDDEDTGLPGPVNTAFDLDFSSICFVPSGGGFSVSSAFEGDGGFTCAQAVVATSQIPTISEWGLIATAGILGIIGFMVIRRKKTTA